MAAKRIKDPETGKEIVIGKDNRVMHENSLNNFDNENNPHQWQPGQSGNVNGGPKSADKIFKAELMELLQEPYWKDKDKKQKKALIKQVLEKAIDKYMKTDNDNTFLRLLDLFVCSTDGKAVEVQSNVNPIINNVIYLPEKQAVPVTIETIPDQDTTTDD